MLVEGQIKFNFDNHGYDDQGDIRRGGYFGFDPPSLVSGQLTVQFTKCLLQWNLDLTNLYIMSSLE